MRERNKAVPMVDTASLTREEWLEYRKHGLGASDIPVIMGVSPYKTVIKLFEEKSSRKSVSEIEQQIEIRKKQESLTERESFDFGEYGNPIIDPNTKFHLSTEIGHALEPIAGKYLSCRLGMPVFKDTIMYQHPDYPFLFANYDYFMLMPDDNGELSKLVIVECKTATYWKKDEWEKGVPYNYELQCRAGMSVFDVDEVLIICLLDNNEGGVFTYQIYRDLAVEQKIIINAKKFWNHVLSKTLPLPSLPSKQAAAEMAEYASNYPKRSIPVELFAEGLQELVEDYKEKHLMCEKLTKELEAEQERLDAMKIQLSTFMLSYDKAKTDALTLRWSERKSRSVDYDGLRVAYPEIYAKFVTEKTSLGFHVKVHPSTLEKENLKGAA